MKNLAKNFVFILLILIIISGVFSLFSSSAKTEKTIAISQLVWDINQNKIKSITLTGDNIAIIYNDDSTAKSQKETGADLGQTLINYGVNKDALDKVSIDIILLSFK